MSEYVNSGTPSQILNYSNKDDKTKNIFNNTNRIYYHIVFVFLLDS